MREVGIVCRKMSEDDLERKPLCISRCADWTRRVGRGVTCTSPRPLCRSGRLLGVGLGCDWGGAKRLSTQQPNVILFARSRAHQQLLLLHWFWTLGSRESPMGICRVLMNRGGMGGVRRVRKKKKKEREIKRRIKKD